MRLDSSVLCDYILKQLKCINDDSNSDNRESVPDWEGNFSIVDSLESEEKLGSLSLKLLTSKRGSEQNMVCFLSICCELFCLSTYSRVSWSLNVQ